MKNGNVCHECRKPMTFDGKVQKSWFPAFRHTFPFVIFAQGTKTYSYQYRNEEANAGRLLLKTTVEDMEDF
jgi:hypothetical protein